MVDRIINRSIQFESMASYQTALKEFKRPELGECLKNEFGVTSHPNNLIEKYLILVAYNGQTLFEWNLVRPAFLWKLEVVLDDMISQSKENGERKSELDSVEYCTQLKQDILSRAHSFTDAPFTIQRLCELLISPTRHYNSSGKFLRAVEKTVNVVTCVSPLGDRVAKALEDESEEEDEPCTRVENNFIVSVDELDDPIEMKHAHPEAETQDSSPTPERNDHNL